MNKYITEIRVKHWIKNLLIFFPMICSKSLNTINLINTIIGFFSFCLMSSFIYIINDIKDIEKDRKNPNKKNRPIASGAISKKIGLILAFICFTLSIFMIFFINCSNKYITIIILFAYMIINIFYSFGLKNIEIVDIILLSSGFIFRVFYGATIVDVIVSSWLFLTVFNGALFLSIGKRKKELQNNKTSRSVLNKYNFDFLDKFQYLCLGLTIVFYSLWTIEQNISYLLYTIPLVMIIIMKYCLIIESGNDGDPTTILYKDKTLLVLSLIYMFIMFVIETLI